MRCLWLISLLALLTGCSFVYKGLTPVKGNINTVQKFRPDFKRALYKADIDVTSHHLSGLLLFKQLPDSSLRVIFSNELGLKFFDFGLMPDGSFKVYYIIRQMDKKPVVKTLRKDFALIAFERSYLKSGYILKDETNLYYIFPQPKGTFCYLTDLKGNNLKSMKIASPAKFIVTAIATGAQSGVPDSISIVHQNFKFNISLKRLNN